MLGVDKTTIMRDVGANAPLEEKIDTDIQEVINDSGVNAPPEPIQEPDWINEHYPGKLGKMGSQREPINMFRIGTFYFTDSLMSSFSKGIRSPTLNIGSNVGSSRIRPINQFFSCPI